MTFYLKPPRGVIEYHVLQKCAEERMKFFINTSNVVINRLNIEYLIEDSAFDRAGHYMLRLAAIQNINFLHSFIHYEVKLLKMRLGNHNSFASHKFLKKLLRHCNECVIEYQDNENVAGFLRTLVNVLTKMCSRSYRQHVIQEGHLSSDNCKLFTINVPYIYCTTLVAERQVRLRNGYASIICDKWVDLILSLFYTFLTISLTEMKHNRNTHAALNDHRIKSILHTLFEQTSPIDQSKLEDFNRDLKYFPLCMQNYQNILQRNHRLPHDERFVDVCFPISVPICYFRYNYSLFLKDIGMSLEDSLAFWKNEYLKDGSGCGTCCHSWQKDEKRYVYGIRHLYGLEGSRKNYRSRSCHYFQNNCLSATQQGGCPFRYFDNNRFTELLSKISFMDTDNVNTVLSARKHGPSSACRIFMEISVKYMNIDGTHSSQFDKSVFRFNDPVEYFHVIKNFK
ncbi:hypothetical protein FQR65_LT00962 [Abscondita terminalis]|nr:hypothetical protein FQR65_LT00962 [Abscondita terminalis]